MITKFLNTHGNGFWLHMLGAVAVMAVGWWTGWLPWKWSRGKNAETWIPVAVVIAVAFCVQLIVH